MAVPPALRKGGLSSTVYEQAKAASQEWGRASKIGMANAQDVLRGLGMESLLRGRNHLSALVEHPPRKTGTKRG